jgi:hypothetical protein
MVMEVFAMGAEAMGAEESKVGVDISDKKIKK